MNLSKPTTRGSAVFPYQKYRNSGYDDMEIDSPPLTGKALPQERKYSGSRFSAVRASTSGRGHDIPATAVRPAEPLIRLAGTKRRGEAVEMDQPAMQRSGSRTVERPDSRRPSKSTTAATRRKPCYFTAPSSSLYPRDCLESERPRGMAEGVPQKRARTGSHHHSATAQRQQPDEALMLRDLSNKNFDFYHHIPSVSSNAGAFPYERRSGENNLYEKPAVKVVKRSFAHESPAVEVVKKHLVGKSTVLVIAKGPNEPRAPARRSISATMTPAELARSRCSLATPATTRQDPLWKEYAGELLAHLAELERKIRPSALYMSKQYELNADMRKILVNWLTSVTVDFKLTSETLALTVDITDRFLSRKRVTRENFQLVGITALFIASKVEEIHACSLAELVGVCANAYTAKQIVYMENNIARALEFRFHSATAWDFCSHYWRLLGAEPSAGEPLYSRTGASDEDRRRLLACRDARGLPGWTESARELSQYLIDLSQTDYRFLQYLRSEIAISAIVMALHGLYLHYCIPTSAVPQFTPEYILAVSGYDVSSNPRVQGCILALNCLREDASRQLREARAGSGNNMYDGLWAKYPGVE